MLGSGALLLAFALGAAAHTGCGGHEIGRRNPGGRLIERQSAPTDEASAATSTDPTFECTGYSYAPLQDIKANFPTLWETASILSSDTEAMALFETINATLNSKLPNDLPKGDSNGSFAGVTYSNTDPDCWWSWHQCTTPDSSLGLPNDIVSVPEPETWGLGFDDGPNCSHNALYDYLLENDQKATMFYIGSNVYDWPLQGLRATAENHQICVHTWSHQYMTAFSNENAFAELYYTQKIIHDILGVTPTCWRPPYGDVDNRIRMIAQGLNMTTIVWSDDTEDWRVGAPGSTVTDTDVDNNYQAVISKVGNGTYVNSGPVVLNHELNNFTMSEFMKWYPQIKSTFKAVVPIATAYNNTHPYEEQNITYPDFSDYENGNENVTTGAVSTSGSASGSATSSGASGSASASASSGSSSSSSASAKSGAGRAMLPMGQILAALSVVFVGVATLL